MRPRSFLCAGLLLAWLVPAGAAAQVGDVLRLVHGGSGSSIDVDVTHQRGYAAIAVSDLSAAGWSWTRAGTSWVGRAGPDRGLEILPGVPFIQVNGATVQLTDSPYLFGSDLMVPVQLVLDVLPDRFPGVWAAGADDRTLRVLDVSLWQAEPGRAPIEAAPAVDLSSGFDVAPEEDSDPVRVVIIDPGHGGEDPGAMGPRGEREKDVALQIGLELRRALADVPNLEVYMTREDDRLVPLWRRGAMATELKGDRSGVFVSIHANAVASRSVRGFETYFLSEARTEHEKRVEALENSAVQLETRTGQDLSADPELGFILNELRNFDHQHWSADLAAVVQRRTAAIHPGPNRGVKQGLLAVITNSLMPSVLVEVGFISNPDEARTLTDRAFAREVGEAMAAAILEFFERYPPRRSAGSGGGR